MNWFWNFVKKCQMKVPDFNEFHFIYKFLSCNEWLVRKLIKF